MLQEDALQVSEQIFTIEERVKILLKESQAIFLNGLTPLETMQNIIEKIEETRKAVRKVKKIFVNKAQSEVPSLEVIIEDDNIVRVLLAHVREL